MPTQSQKAAAFVALHQGQSAFILPNPWNIGTARLLERLGFEAIATTSMGYAFSAGKLDYTLTREEVLQHISVLAAATDLPLSTDLENGFGDSPERAAETITLAAAAGAVGGSIEDTTGNPEQPIYVKEHAAERIRAAASAARALAFPFTLTARAENYLHGRRDLKDTISRLQAYQEAGADVLYAPGLATRDEIAAVVHSVDRPVNVLMGLSAVPLSLSDLSTIGVRRVSVGSALSRAVLGTFLSAAREMREQGTFAFTKNAASPLEISSLLKP